ncbi:hypothetical protein AAFF_G00253590 [Aldrovandia affinis]|uniref:Astrotactin-1/2 N-terminal domain-containing protein n=1 Tax=Aldrovandia affinis TaxID=143900 RepID=A0AAD7STY7_9TELE|nr:hypothetical protein AAFF_G00253590 [Aldrovandia affinis]
MSGTGAELSQVHWRQQWLENGTLYFHVSTNGVEQVYQATPPTVREPAHVLHEHMHLLHISVMGGLIALLLLILLFTLVLYTRHRWCKRRRVPQKSASTEATHEIHYIPSVLLGPQGRDTFRGPSRLQQHGSVIGLPIRETPILDDYDCNEDDDRPEHLVDQLADCDCQREEEDSSSQLTHTMDSLGRGEELHSYSLGKRGGRNHWESRTPRDCLSPWSPAGDPALKPKQEAVDALMLNFKEGFHTTAGMEFSHLQHVTHSSSTSRKRPTNSRSQGGVVFAHPGYSGPEAHDENQLKFFTEQHKGRRRSKGYPHSPLNKAALTLVTISTCVLAVVYSSQVPCPLSVKVTLHVPEHFIADGSSFVVSVGSYLDLSNWLNPAQLTLYYQNNSSSQWVRDYCGQRTTDPCEQLCDEETGECSCQEGYAPDPEHTHLCVRSEWGRNEGPWPYTNLEKGYDLVTGQQAPERIFRSSYSLGQGLWLPVSKSFVVPPVELSINPIASCKTDVLVTEDPGDVREEAIMSTYFETVDDLLSSFGPVRDCSKDNGGCRKNFKCVSDRRVDSTGCMCPDGLRPMKDGSGCYDYSKGTDCSDGFNGGCEQLCLQQITPLPEDPSSSNVHMFCGGWAEPLEPLSQAQGRISAQADKAGTSSLRSGRVPLESRCVQEYKLAADGRSCLLQTEGCEGPKCQRLDAHFNHTLFGEMLHGYNNKSQQVNLGQVFQMTFR